MSLIIQKLDEIIGEIQARPVFSQPTLNALKLLTVASDILKNDDLFDPMGEGELDVTPLIQTPVDPKDLTVTTNLNEVFSKNPYKDDPEPFVLCKPEPGFAPYVKRAGSNVKELLGWGERIRNGDELWVVADNDISASTLPCCGLYYPYGRLGGELFNFAKPFAVQNRKDTGFKFELKGNGMDTEVVNFSSAY